MTPSRVPCAPRTSGRGPLQTLVYRQAQVTAAPNAATDGLVSCDPGFKATGGGARADDVTGAGAGLRLQSVFPNGLDKWDADYFNGGTSSATFRVWVVCATVAATG